MKLRPPSRPVVEMARTLSLWPMQSLMHMPVNSDAADDDMLHCLFVLAGVFVGSNLSSLPAPPLQWRYVCEVLGISPPMFLNLLSESLTYRFEVRIVCLTGSVSVVAAARVFHSVSLYFFEILHFYDCNFVGSFLSLSLFMYFDENWYPC